jgi:RND superfamily putative drug exporter
MGVILGVAVLLDTLLVRLLLLPALLRLLDAAAWWTPRLLNRLPQGLRLRHGGSPDPAATQPGAVRG